MSGGVKYDIWPMRPGMSFPCWNTARPTPSLTTGRGVIRSLEGAMKKKRRECLKCGRKINGDRWLCPSCKKSNRRVDGTAVGVSDLYPGEGRA